MERHESWLERARSSYEIAVTTPYTRSIYYEDLCYQTQQAAEKAIKGLLIYYGVEPEFTHIIERLLTEAEKFADIPETVRVAIKLTDYAIQTRYPGEYDEVTKGEYEKAVRMAKDCLEWVENTIRENEKKKT